MELSEQHDLYIIKRNHDHRELNRVLVTSVGIEPIALPCIEVRPVNESGKQFTIEARQQFKHIRSGETFLVSDITHLFNNDAIGGDEGVASTIYCNLMFAAYIAGYVYQQQTKGETGDIETNA